MVDRDSRNKAATVLREFADGAISNEEYEQWYPKSESDPALPEIFLQIWFLYSDLREHKLTGKYALNADQSVFVERCILFLRSNVEFEWPSQRIDPWWAFLRFLRLRKKMEEVPCGDWTVWPFFDKEQYEQARAESVSGMQLS